MAEASEIFALRRAGKLEQAFELAQQVLQENSNDQWVIRAYGWVLYDKLKVAIQGRDSVTVRELSEQLQQLNVPADDEVLRASIAKIITQSQPHYQQWNRAREMDRNHQYAEALVIYRQLKNLLGQEQEFANAYGWCLYKYIKQLLENGQTNLGQFTSLFLEYLPLNTIRPSNLHSNILRLGEKLSENAAFPFHSIFLGWGPTNFSDEDWNKNHWQGKVYPGLAEKVVQQLAKKLLQQGSAQEIADFDPIISKALEKISDNIWLFYYKAKLLIKAGHRDQALEFLIPVVKLKRTEYWAWSLLGEVYKESAPNKSLSCYCKAMLCPAEEKFLTTTRASLAKMLIQAGRKNEAKTEYSFVINFKRANGLDVPIELSLLEQQQWFKEAALLEHNRKFYIDNKNLAEEILFNDLPWKDANVGATYTIPSDPKTQRVKLYVLDEGELVEVSIKDRLHKISKRFNEGQALKIKAENINGKWQVYVVEKRPEGDKWDVFQEYLAVIDHVNTHKHVAHFIIDKYIDGIINLPTKQVTLLTGDIIRVRLKNREKDRKVIYEALAWEKTQDKPSLNTLKPFSGVFSIKDDNHFGFVDELFVEPTLVQQYNLRNKNGKVVNGFAVINFNKNKRTWGWKALTINY